MTTYTQAAPIKFEFFRFSKGANPIKKAFKRHQTRKVLQGLTDYQRRDIGLLPKSVAPTLSQPLW